MICNKMASISPLNCDNVYERDHSLSSSLPLSSTLVGHLRHQGQVGGRPEARLSIKRLLSHNKRLSLTPGAEETIGHLLQKERVSKQGLYFVQQNLHKGRPATNELNPLGYDIGLVQEPSIHRGSKKSLIEAPRRSFCMANASAAAIKGEGLDYWPVEAMSTRDLAIVALELGGEDGTIYVASCYLDILLPVPTPE